MRAFILASTAAATDLAVTWSDCGDSSYHVKMTDVQPSVITMGGTTTITGSGTLDEDITDAVTFDLAMETQFVDCKGVGSTGKKCNFPLALGSIDFLGMQTPFKAGEIPVNVDVLISRTLPASLLETTTLVTGKGKDSGNKIFCINVYTKKSADSKFGKGVLDVSWSDCGDADTKSLVHDLQPAQLTQGVVNHIVGNGTLSEDVNEDIEFETSMRVKFVSCAGDASVDKKCSFPLAMGSIAMQAIPSPIPAGDTSINVDISMSELVPKSVAITTTHVTAKTASGDNLFCVDVNTAAAQVTDSITV